MKPSQEWLIAIGLEASYQMALDDGERLSRYQWNLFCMLDLLATMAADMDRALGW